MLINMNDPLYETMQQHMLRTGEALRLKVMNGLTSVENVPHLLFTEIIQTGFTLARSDVHETDASVISYTREDWIADNRHFARRRCLSEAEFVAFR